MLSWSAERPGRLPLADQAKVVWQARFAGKSADEQSVDISGKRTHLIFVGSLVVSAVGGLLGANDAMRYLPLPKALPRPRDPGDSGS